MSNDIENNMHDHPHDHPHTHDHVHPHTHDHDHSHDHVHPHTHDHTHDDPSVGGKDPEEIKALLAYMIHHNEHHNEELADLLPSLPEKARKRMQIAIGAFEAANVELQEVLDEL